MFNDIVKELTEVDAVELIYYNVNSDADNNTSISYDVIVDGDSIMSDFNTSKKIIAVMEVTKTLLSKYNVSFNYTIKAANTFEKEILHGIGNTLDNFQHAQVFYARDDYFLDIAESIRINGNKRA